MWMSVFLLFFTFENVYSQGSLECADSDTCSENWTPENYTGNMGNGITGRIWYRFRNCNGISQIIIDSTEALDNGKFLDSLNVYHYQYSAFSDLADIYLLQHKYIDSVQPNPNNPKTLIQLYKASCGVWLACTYNVDPASRECDTGYTPPYPVTTDVDEAPLSIYKWHPCGTVCCKKTYEIYRKQVYGHNPTPGYYPIVFIKNISITRSQLTPECTLDSNFAKPCEDGC
jgi:hypothetical protein